MKGKCKYCNLKLTGIIMLLLILGFDARTQKQVGQNKVLIIEIKAEIDPKMNRYVQLALQHAKDIKAKGIVIEMNTFGGALNDADEIRTAILEFPAPVIVFINKNAASAGALISLSCDSIYMAPGANIGAATVVSQDGIPAPGKYQSYMRSLMRSTAEANHRNPALAEAMVDEDLAADSLNQAGKVLTLTTDEALKYHYCEKKINALEEAIVEGGFASYKREKFQLSSSEHIINFFLNPLISGILILIIIGGIYFEFQHPGLIFPIAIALIALALYFIPYYLNGLAANWEILLFFVGIIFLAVEIFVIPGFGITGVTGIVLIMASLVLVTLNNNALDFSFVAPEEITKSILTMISGLTGGIILIIVGGYKLTQSNRFKNKMALPNVQDKSNGYTANFNTETMTGKIGTAFTILRPSGKIMIGDKIYDAYSWGEFIEKNTQIIVVSEEGTSLKVKALNS